jgi:Spy/CpxP family protein refolding chaperone
MGYYNSFRIANELGIRHPLLGGNDAENLTDAQKAQIKPIVQKYRDQFKALRAQNLDPQAKREQAQTLRKQMREEIARVLTPEQRQKLQSLREQHRAARGQKG